MPHPLDLCLDQKSIFSLPLERTLIKELIRHPAADAYYDRKTHHWVIKNGRKIIYNTGKKHSSLVVSIMLLFHRMGLYFSSNYRRKFNSATVKLVKAQDFAYQERNREKRQLIHRMDIFSKASESIDMAKKRNADLKKTLEDKKLKDKRKFEETVNDLNEQKKNHTDLKNLLKNYQAAVDNNDQNAQMYSIEKLKECPAFFLLDLPKASRGEIDTMIEHQNKMISRLDKKINHLKQQWTFLEKKFESDTAIFTDQEKKIEEQQNWVRASPLLKKPCEAIKDPQKLTEEQAAQESKEAGAPQLSEATYAFLSAIEDRVGKRGRKVWQGLFLNCLKKHKQDMLVNFVKSGSKYTLFFKQPLRIWLYATKENGEEDPPGGIILMLGMNNNKMTVNFNVLGKMVFENGAQIFTKTPSWVITLFAPVKWLTLGKFSIPNYIPDAKVEYFMKRTNDSFSFSAQWRGKSKERIKSYKELKHNWRNVGEPLASHEIPRNVINKHLH